MASQSNAIPVLVFAATIGGVLEGLSITLVKRVMAAYYPAGQTRAPAALLAAVCNSGAITGAMFAGALVSRFGPVPMFAAHGLVGIPLILVLVLRSPQRKPEAYGGSRPFQFVVSWRRSHPEYAISLSPSSSARSPWRRSHTSWCPCSCASATSIPN